MSDDNGSGPKPLPNALQGPAKRKNILVTSALPYVNNVPHLGNIVGAVLSADVYARYCRQRGHNVVYVCGTDEYGTATEKRAAEEGVTPSEICAKYFALHRDIYAWFDCKFDKFGRTTTDEQTEIAQDIFLKLHANGYILEDDMEQLYCGTCDKFQADRFVEGTCPLCNAEGARGDQCDVCGHLLNAVELKNPICKTCGSTPVVKSTRHLFLDLPKISERLSTWLDGSTKEGKWSPNATSIAQSWIKEGLQPRCITRDLKWGTPVPLDGFRDKVFYVWFDAPIGYISITATLLGDKPSHETERTGSGWKEWWKPSGGEKIELHQFMGKDNVPFHSIVFPATLLAADDGWTTIHHLNATEYLNYEDTKFSKSNGIGVFGNHCQETGVPSEVWRYYLLSLRPETSDAAFVWSDLRIRNNSELIANLGNFCNRGLSFTFKNFDGKVPQFVPASLTDAEVELERAVNEELVKYNRQLARSRIREAVRISFEISRLGNGYMQAQQPWVLLKGGDDEKARAASVLYTAVSLIQLLASILQPFMPSFSKRVFEQLGCPERDDTPCIPDTWSIAAGGKALDDAGETLGEFLPLVPGSNLGKPEILFKQLSEAQIDEWRARFAGTDVAQDTAAVFPLDIRGGVIKAFRPHKGDEKRELVVVDVDVGEDKTRQIVGRLGPVLGADMDDAARSEALVGRNVAVLCNLPPADLRGETSEGMCLVAETKKTKTQPARQILLSGFAPGTAADDNSSSSSSSWAGTRFCPADWESPTEPITLQQFQKVDIKVAAVPTADLDSSKKAETGDSAAQGKKGKRAAVPSDFIVVFNKDQHVSADGARKVFLTAEGVKSVCRVK
jgi:methionyl-tRNA synthetase